VTFSDDSMVRPTASRVREAIISMIAPYRHTHAFVDLFSGSGVLGFSALSVGFSQVVMLEREPDICDDLKSNAKRLGAQTRIHHLCAEKLDTINLSPPVLIYSDPPYLRRDLYEKVLASLLDLPAFDSQSLCLLESDRRLCLSPPDGLIQIKEKVFGRTKIAFFGRAVGTGKA